MRASRHEPSQVCLRRRPLFLGLIGDLFPGLDCPRVRYPQMNDVVEEDLAENGYKVMTEPSQQVDKVIQLYETMMTRHTTMVVGNTDGRKSVIIDTLARSQTKLGRITKLHIVNPKAQTVSELYRELDPERAIGQTACCRTSSASSTVRCRPIATRCATSCSTVMWTRCGSRT